MYQGNILIDGAVLFWVALAGLVCGSFLGQLIDRLPKNKKVWDLRERSRCPRCKKKLKARDLIPLLSFVLLRGRCRYCHKPISLHYPLVELLAAVVTLYWYWNSGNGLEFFLQCGFWYTLLLIALIDWHTQTVLNFSIWLSGLLAMTLAVLHGVPSENLWAALVAFGVFAGVAYLGKWYYGREALGGGDIYIAGVAGMYLGMPLAFFAFYVALLAGGILALYLIFFKRKNSKSKIAFGPALILGITISQLFGDTILKWYLG